MMRPKCANIYPFAYVIVKSFPGDYTFENPVKMGGKEAKGKDYGEWEKERKRKGST